MLRQLEASSIMGPGGSAGQTGGSTLRQAETSRGAATPRRSLARSSVAALALGTALVAGQTVPAAAQATATAPVTQVPSFAELAEQLSPAVVNITTTTTVADVQRGPGPMVPEGSPFEDFFRDFLDQGPNGPQQRQRRSNALGSGFIISADGYIVTNNHVIEAADEVSVELYSGEELDAEVVGVDPRTDLALLKITADRTFPFVTFGDSDAARVGDWVMAIGNPLGQGFSVSAGIVSARNRTLQGSYDDFIQTDAAINRGNSGGPLFNMDGEVIGVNTAILSPTGGSIGIGFAMSAAVVSHVVDQLRNYGETRRGWLGVRIQNVDPDVADALGLEEAAGALVTDVPEGPAADAGMQSGDVIVEFGGEAIDDTRELVRVVADTDPGERVEVRVFRDGRIETLSVEVGLLEEPTLAAATAGDDPTQAAPQEESLLGMTLAGVGDAERQQFALSQDTNGVVVLELDEASDAYLKGVRVGDVITEVGQQSVATPGDVRDQVEAAEQAGRNSVLLLVRRDGQPRFVALNLSS
jgi:serine protease Do